MESQSDYSYEEVRLDRFFVSLASGMRGNIRKTHVCDESYRADVYLAIV